MRLDDDGAVTGFAPRGPSARGTFHFIGVQVVSAEAFQSVARGAVASSIGEVYDRLIAERPGCVRGYVSDAAFWDIGTVDRLLADVGRLRRIADAASLDADATSRSHPARR